MPESYSAPANPTQAGNSAFTPDGCGVVQKIAFVFLTLLTAELSVYGRVHPAYRRHAYELHANSRPAVAVSLTRLILPTRGLAPNATPPAF